VTGVPASKLNPTRHPFDTARRFLLLALAWIFSSDTPGRPIAEADYSAKIVGNWMGTVGEMKESVTFSSDGTFTSQLRPTGFISNTLG